MCRQRDLADDGTKAKLADRLLAETRPVYSFPSRSRCPRCVATDTEATSTQGNVQYRQCRRAICRHRCSVMGVKA